MLQMASVYGVQQIAKHAPAFFSPRVAEVSTVVAFACFKGITIKHAVESQSGLFFSTATQSRTPSPLRVNPPRQSATLWR